MHQKLEIKNLKIRVYPEVLDQMMTSDALSAEIPLPVIPGKTKIRPGSFSLVLEDENQFAIRTVVPVDVVNPDWKMAAIVDLFLSVQISLQPFHRKDDDGIRIRRIELLEKSEFSINDQPIRLIPAINQILEQIGSEILPAGNKILANKLLQYSKEYFGNDFLVRLADDLYFQVSSAQASSSFDFSLSATSGPEGLSNPEADSSSIRLRIPGNEFQYLLAHLPVPPLSAAGYQMVIDKIEVTGSNELSIRLKDDKKGVSIDLQAKLILDGNMLRLQVGELDVKGLGWMKSGLFRILRNTIIRQIEKKPVDLSSMYRSLIYDMSRKYPFLRIQENKELLLQELEISPEYFSAFIRFGEPKNHMETSPVQS